jgi:general secretion pathway protein G
VNSNAQLLSIPASVPAPGKTPGSRYVIGSILIIAGILGGLFYFSGGIYRMTGSVEYGRHVRILGDIQAISIQLELYENANGRYPTTEQGLQALVIRPDSDPKPAHWSQLLQEKPKDPWQHDYIYRCPGIKNPNGYDLFSAGPDGKPDTADDDWGG